MGSGIGTFFGSGIRILALGLRSQSHEIFGDQNFGSAGIKFLVTEKPIAIKIVPYYDSRQFPLLACRIYIKDD